MATRDTQIEVGQTRVPAVRTRSRGRVGGTLEHLAMTFEKANPGMKTRWVYSPLHKPELSNVVARKVDGWREVYVRDLLDAQESLGQKPDEVVRMGDVILMQITEDELMVLKQENIERAEEQAARVQEDHYENIRQVSVPGMREEHRVQPRGRTSIDFREQEVDTRKVLGETIPEEE